MGERTEEYDWLRLDNAAKIYPATHSDAAPAVFRVSVTLHEAIRIRDLQEALEALIDRVPYYQVHLKRGFFWYYLQRHDEYPKIRPLPEEPLSQISLHQSEEQLLRVYAREGTVAVDFSHVLTDGYGAMRFLGSLIVEYLRRIGEPVPPGPLLMEPGTAVPPQEYEDTFQQHYKPEAPKAPDLEPAYHVGGMPFIRGYRTVTGRMSVADALATSKRYGATLTEYIAAAYMFSIKKVYDQQESGVIKPRNKIIRIEVPVNMRRIHQSVTMRNFSLFVSPEIDLRLGSWTFEEIIRRVHHEMNIQLEPNELARQISRNVGGERSTLVRIIPRALKDAYLGYLRRTIGDRSYSGVVSNLGRFILPEAAKPYVESAGFVLGPNAAYKTCCAVVSYGDVLTITFGSVIQNRAVERGFFRKLADDGLDILVSEQAP
ncbi:MAG: hypothetical protein ACOC2Q_01345 [Spirochaetota bacterium]